MQAIEDASSAVAKTPNRVTLAALEANIADKYFIYHRMTSGAVLTICVLECRNGFSVVGIAAPADPANYDKALGEQFAYDNAAKQLWPLMGYALRDKLIAEAN